MEQYTGTLVSNAKLMTRGEYNALRGWQVPADENPDDVGYLVERIDSKPNHADFSGYISWLPKDVFEQIYKPSGTYIDRMNIELAELQTRLTKLKSFLENGKPDFLGDKEFELLLEQVSIMTDYASVLSNRIEFAKVKESN